MKLIVTGFGPFGLTRDNPSRDVAEALCELLRSRGIDAEFHPLDTSMASVRAFYSGLPASGDAFALHLGVDPTSAALSLETQARNWGDFGRPDVGGEFLREEPITDRFPPRHCLANALDVRALAAAAPGFAVSDDAGDFVCNFAYWVALESVGAQMRGCLFAHVPPFRVVARAAQVARLAALCGAILRRFE
jgi:pyroglutamyl-peptidase